MNFDINNNEKVKKYAVIGSIVLLMVGLVLGIRLIRERADLRNRAEGPPVCTPELLCTVDQTGNFRIKVYQGTNPTPVITGEIGATGVPFPFNAISSESYRCEVVSEDNPLCIEQTTVGAPICLAPTATPTVTLTPTSIPTTPTASPIPTDGGGSQLNPICQDCTKITIDISYPTPMSVEKENELKIGIVKIIPNSCDIANLSCDNIERFYIAAASGPVCPNVLDNTSIEDYDPPSRGDFDINIITDPKKACLMALGDPTAPTPGQGTPTSTPPPGVPFRLHQALGADCRCYQFRLDFKPTPGAGPVCPAEMQICCPQECKPPEIIDDPDDQDDGCLGDPSAPTPTPGGPTLTPTPTGQSNHCYFQLMEPNACPNINQLAKFRTQLGTNYSSGGNIEFDDDFRQSSQHVIAPVDNPEFTYQDAGVYDVELKCGTGNTVRSCKKRIYVTCNSTTTCPNISYVTPQVCR